MATSDAHGKLHGEDGRFSVKPRSDADISLELDSPKIDLLSNPTSAPDQVRRLAAEMPRLPTPRQYVILGRFQDFATDIDTFGSQGDVEVIEVNDDDFADQPMLVKEAWANHMIERAAEVADADARAKLIDHMRKATSEMPSAYGDALDALADCPVRKVVTPQTAIHTGPQEIRDAFEAVDPERFDPEFYRWVTQDASDGELAEVTLRVMLRDDLYEAWHRALDDEAGDVWLNRSAGEP
jgi:hypothetical protein